MEPFLPVVNTQKGTVENKNIFRLMEQYGSPLLVMCERIIKAKYSFLQKALNQYYPNSSIAYSVKTNFLPGILKVFLEIGALAEAVSGFEYWLAKRVGFSENSIIFNGPDKKTSEIEAAIHGGATLNVDNYHELERLGAISSKIRRPIPMGLRVNTSILDLTWSRFGFKIEGGEALRIVETISKNFLKLNIAGLHLHMSTNLNDVSYYKIAAEKLSDFALLIREKFNIRIEYLDLGGGFPVPASRRKNNKPIWTAPPINDYISSIADVLNQKFGDEKPKLILEPGRYLIDEAGVFLTTVKNAKITKDFPPASLSGIDLSIRPKSSEKCQLVNVDSSIVSVPKSTLLHHRRVEHIATGWIKSYSNGEKQYPTYIAGNSCLGYDFLAGGIYKQELRPEDRLLFYNTGAYSIVRAEQFIHPRPAVLLLQDNGSVKCLRSKETFEDMTSLDGWD